MERTQNFAMKLSGKPSTERFDEFEPGRSEFEDRLNDIAKRINDLHASAYKCDVVKSTDSRETCEPGVELRVKAEAARWMLRVAKHLTGPTREKVFTAVQKSLDDIEKIVASYPQPIADNIPPDRARAAHAVAGR
jgi:hypothetical protein